MHVVAKLLIVSRMSKVDF